MVIPPIFNQRLVKKGHPKQDDLFDLHYFTVNSVILKTTDFSSPVKYNLYLFIFMD